MGLPGMSQVVPVILGTVRTGFLEGIASGTSWDVPSSPSFSLTVRTGILEVGLPGMSQVVPVILGTVRTGILEGLASGTYWDDPGSPSFSWDCQDWDSRGDSIWDFSGCPK